MSTPKYLSREEILTAEDIQTEEVEVKEWKTKGNPKGLVLVRGLTGQERDRFQISVMKNPGKSTEINLMNASSKLVSLCVIDEKGKRVFNQRDVLALSKKSGAAINTVFTVCQRLSGLTSEDLEELTENLSLGQSDNSSSS